MTINKKKLASLTYYPLVVCLYTVTSLLPGFLLVEDRVTLSSEVLVFVTYILVSEISQLIIRLNKQKNSQTSLGLYTVKIMLSLVLIWSVARNFSVQYAIILLVYEIFQFLSFSEQYNFQNSLLQLMVATFFKAIVFNLILSLSFPYTFKLFYFTPYIFNSLLLFIGTLLRQQNQALAKHNKTWFIVSLLAVSGLIALLISQLQTKEIQLLPLIFLLAILLITITMSQVTIKQQYKEVILLIAVVVCQLVYYL